MIENYKSEDHLKNTMKMWKGTKKESFIRRKTEKWRDKKN